jgi:predicted metal-dependent phosphoesterase TrpH
VTEAPAAGFGADLHTHSTASDGSLTPSELLRRAAGLGVRALSLTDHDTVKGLEEAMDAAGSAGVGFLTGVELSVGYEDTEIHLLGYGMEPGNRALRETLDVLASERYDRMEKMVARLREAGVPAVFDDVRRYASGAILSRLHLATYLHEKGFVSSREEAFNRYIGNGRPAYVRRRHLTLKKAIELIVTAGGLPVLAHPGLTKRDDLIEYLVRIGIRGIETHYPMHSAGDTARYLKLCERYDLFPTGGSDFHGDKKPRVDLGSHLTPAAVYEQMIRAVRQRPAQ